MRELPIFLASNNKFAPFCATTIASFCANTKKKLHFYILDSGISNQNKQKIVNTKDFYNNFELTFVPIDTEEKFRNFPVMKHITRDMYSRFLIPQILPDYDKVMYSDVDVIAVGDVAELFKEDMSDYILAAVPEYRVQAKDECAVTRERLNLSQKHQPFDSGLLLLNCRMWNEQNIDAKLYDIANDLCHRKVLKYPDQDILNKYFENSYLRLDKKFCVFPKHLKGNWAVPEIETVKKASVILHYAGGMTKPWYDKSLSGAEEFWKYVDKTDFAKEIRFIYSQFLIKKSAKMLIRRLFSVTSKKHNGRKQKVVCFLGAKITFHVN